MNDAIETAGMIATGGILAREVERLHASDASGHDASGACANCGAALEGPFCRMCGQHGHVHRTAGALVHDILHGVFHFEGKFWSTLPKLAFRPGELTRRYVHGERAKFVSPMAMFLFSVFLLFAVVANLPGWSIGGGDFLNGAGVQGGMDKARASLDQARAKADANFVRRSQQLAKLRADPEADPAEVTRAERRVASARDDRRQVLQAQAFLPDAAAKAKTPSKPDNWFEQKVQHAKENPKLLLYKMKSSAYKFSWALIPLSLPFLWILFPLRRGVGLYDHAIFATYSLSFMSLLMVALGLLGLIGIPNAVLVIAALAIPPVHIYHQFKRAYLLTRFGALWRTFWMVNFIGIIVPMFVLMLLYLGVAD
ncbi:DUF3667 domain-containing protein [Sphingomonas donggukensis]|uniref:DUF3667 domain-containing protein n=1 Tax=Sphingomonas donggukensis TaxID=2949093 RepID=A0ABY4TU09_9SPHN|nr:DUF3667 domain-containing protein [Sphingomonas donggukensis]URW75196.1 DUF3667 domain-containing protein [Sphingomonas donggukensis]